MTRLDPDKPSDVLDRGALVHVTGASTPVLRLGEKPPNRSSIFFPQIRIHCPYEARREQISLRQLQSRGTIDKERK
jgi:hypothetical protein